MELEIEPEPDPAERKAIETAVVGLLEPAPLPPAYLSAWRRAAIRENVEMES